MFENWQYKSKSYGVWQKIPNWCNTHGCIGKAIAQYNSDKKRLIAGFVLPTRAYAAVFLALGIVLTRAKMPVEEIDNANYFLRLCNLPKGTSLYYRQDNKNSKATLEGFETNKWGSYISIKVNSESGVVKLPSSMVHLIQVADQQFDHLPKVPKGSKIVENRGFMAANLVGTDVDKFCQNTRLEVIVVGNETQLSGEINIAIKTISETSKYYHGKPKDILRIKKYSQAGQGYRVDLQSDRTKPINTEGTSIVIFDGARSYLKWRDSWSNSNQIVLLDKTETRYEEAVNTLNYEYINNHIDSVIPQFPTLPIGVESLIYEVET